MGGWSYGGPLEGAHIILEIAGLFIVTNPQFQHKWRLTNSGIDALAKPVIRKMCVKQKVTFLDYEDEECPQVFIPVGLLEHGNTPPLLNSFQIVMRTLTLSARQISIGPQRAKKINDDGKDTGVVYYGPISSTIKKVKLLSLSTCCLSASLGPVITFMTGPGMNMILKGVVASSVILLSASTTAALHWFVSSYVHKLRWHPGSDSFDVEMLSWLARSIPKTIRFSDIRPPQTNRPFVTFKAGNNFYFIDTEHCHNKALLERVTPKEPTHESSLKNA
ncbi:uncharacterized protein LOC143879109 [Tasmannia lanceolata]|uniref:uncharacterized protein LOC143879109 n=1 Tax=Tasmannia lanceolata TaxID=3420 RepID=UPI004062D337